MIKLFKSIRNRHISRGHFNRYAVYALGEILLVVIGILIALQINNWNQQRIDRQEEKVILSNLKEDFQKAIEEFEFLNSLRSDIISAARKITEIAGSDTEQYPEQYLDSLFSRTLYGPTFNHQSRSLEVLLTSGKINLISNPALRKILIEWPGDVEDMKEDEDNQDEIFRGTYLDLLSDYVSWNKMISQYRMNPVRFNEVKLESMPENPLVTSDYAAVLNNKKFLNILHQRASLCMTSNRETSVLMEKTKEIIGMIDKDLN